MKINKNNINIVLADSDKVIRDNMYEFLENIGYNIDTVATNNELLSIIKEKPAQVILLECSEKEQDVIGTIHEINLNQPAAVVMIMLSNPTIKRLLKFVDVGIQNILIKPLSLNDCKKNIERAILQYNNNFEYQIFKENKKMIYQMFEEQGISIIDNSIICRNSIVEV